MNINAILVSFGLLLGSSTQAQVELSELRYPCHGGQQQGFSTAVKGEYILYGGLDYTELHRKCLNGYVCVWQGPPSTDVALSNTHFALGRAQGSHPGGDVWVGSLQSPNEPLTPIAVELYDFTSGAGDALAFSGNDLIVHSLDAVRIFTAPSFNAPTLLSVTGLASSATLDADEFGGYQELIIPTTTGVAVFRKGTTWPSTTTMYFDFPNTYTVDVVMNDGVVAASGFDFSSGSNMHFLRRNDGVWSFMSAESFNIPPGSNGEVAGYFHIAMDQGQLFVNDYNENGPNSLKGFTRHWVHQNSSWSELGMIDENSTYSFPHSGSLGMDADDGVLSVCDFPLQRYFIYNLLPNTTGGPSIVSCGSLNEVPIASTQLQCNSIPGATNYRFQFTTPCGYMRNMPSGSASPSIPISFVQHRLEQCMTYQVKAQAMVNGLWASFGPECTMTTGGCQTPPLQLAPAFCGATLTLNQWVQANRVLGGYSYQFEFTGIPGTMTAGYGPRYLATNVQTTSPPYDQNHPTPECPLNFNTNPLSPCGSYNVRVRRVTGCSTQCGYDQWGPSCSITIAGNCMPMEPVFPVATATVPVVIFPNPTVNGLVNVSIARVPKGVEKWGLKVLDASSRLVHQRIAVPVHGEQVNSELDLRALPPGMYCVVILLGDERSMSKLIID